jgi:hypothetical protein
MTSGAGDDLRTTRNSGGVQSIERVFELLETMADAGGVIGLSQLASQSGFRCPPSTAWSARSWTLATSARSRRVSTRSGHGSSGSATFPAGC